MHRGRAGCGRRRSQSLSCRVQGFGGTKGASDAAAEETRKVTTSHFPPPKFLDRRLQPRSTVVPGSRTACINPPLSRGTSASLSARVAAIALWARSRIGAAKKAESRGPRSLGHLASGGFLGKEKASACTRTGNATSGRGAVVARPLLLVGRWACHGPVVRKKRRRGQVQVTVLRLKACSVGAHLHRPSLIPREPVR